MGYGGVRIGERERERMRFDFKRGKVNWFLTYLPNPTISHFSNIFVLIIS